MWRAAATATGANGPCRPSVCIFTSHDPSWSPRGPIPRRANVNGMRARAAVRASTSSAPSTTSASTARAVRRRAVNVSVVTAMTTGAGGRAGATAAPSAGALTRAGMERFAAYDVEGAIEALDRAIEVDARYRARAWQRGLALYAKGEYDAAARQFREDVAMNPNDTEESVWCFASEAMDASKGVKVALERMLKTGPDARPVMKSVFRLFETGTEEAEAALREAGKRSDGDTFYSLLYLGLFYEVNGDKARAREEFSKANGTLYAKFSGDFMADVSRVLLRRM